MAKRLIYKGAEYIRADGKLFNSDLRISVRNIYNALGHNDLKGYNDALRYLKDLEPVILRLTEEIKNEIKNHKNGKR